MSQDTKTHVQGPWNLAKPIQRRTYSRDDIDIVNEVGSVIATLYAVNFDLEGERDKANARLIAAAPELLEAAIAAIRMSDHLECTACEHCNGVLDTLKTAITKATGKEA